MTKFRADGIGTICGRFYLGTAEKIPDSELIDTTGAGDAFIGAIIYGRFNHRLKIVPFFCLSFSLETSTGFSRFTFFFISKKYIDNTSTRGTQPIYILQSLFVLIILVNVLFLCCIILDVKRFG